MNKNYILPINHCDVSLFKTFIFHVKSVNTKIYLYTYCQKEFYLSGIHIHDGRIVPGWYLDRSQPVQSRCQGSVRKRCQYGDWTVVGQFQDNARTMIGLYQGSVIMVQGRHQVCAKTVLGCGHHTAKTEKVSRCCGYTARTRQETF